MKIKEINIKNFRGIEDLSLTISNFTVLIGKNGVGKSSILHALNFFKEQKYKLKIQDYYKCDLSKKIEVSLTFFNLSEVEKDEFQNYIQNDELRVIKIARGNVELNEPNRSQKYHGLRKMHSGFKEIREETNKPNKKRIYNQIKSEEKYNSLLDIGRQSADVIEGYLIEWEKNHQDELELTMDSGQFFGWPGVGTGKLSKYMEFFFIPAVHEYREEERAEKSSYLEELIDLTIRKAYVETPEINQFKEQTLETYQELISVETEPKTKELSTELSKRLKDFAPGCNVFINYQPGEINFTKTKYGTELEEFGFKGPISFLGHGVQRSFFFTLLQYLGEQRIIEKTQETQSDRNESNEVSVNGSKLLMLLIIEEPELYQHPNQIKLIKKFFQNITEEREDSLFHFQIICSSHSPHLIDIQSVGNVRLLRKVKDNENYIVTIKEVDLDKIAQKLKEYWGFPEETRADETTLISRLISIMTPELSEGFFAEKVVLVEGLEDKSVLLALDQQINENTFDKKEIVVLPVFGKRNLDRPALIFNELEILTYVIFDTDSDKSGADLENHKNLNIVLRKIMKNDDISNPFEQKVEKNWASLNPSLTLVVKNGVNEDYYNREMNELKDYYQFNKTKQCKKNYKVMQDFIEKCYSDGRRIPILEDLIQKIHDL
ncbi:hypothetical protein LCGC14_2065190 [marine sediment metagenome]|uniref:Uncharacterized protein n=1 Tax=marine sediment metagenome TaxID=412755 RepID=A0A0F9EJY2_9ZZZZ